MEMQEQRVEQPQVEQVAAPEPQYADQVPDLSKASFGAETTGAGYEDSVPELPPETTELEEPLNEDLRQPDINQPGAISDMSPPANASDDGGKGELPDLSSASLPELPPDVGADQPPVIEASDVPPPNDPPDLPNLSEEHLPAVPDLDEARQEFEPPPAVDNIDQ